MKITLTTENIRRTVVTNEQGVYAFDGIAPNVVHTVQAELPGFRTETFEGIVVPGGETLSVNLSLKIACVGDAIIDYGQYSPVDALLIAEVVAHVRIAEDSYQAQISTDSNDCPHYTHHATATVLQVSVSSRGGWRSGMAIDVNSDRPLAVGAEYIAFLEYDDIAGRYKIGEPYIAMKVIGGRVESHGGLFGIREGDSSGSALARIIEAHAHHTRYRPLGPAGGEAPLEALRYKTGWLLMGGVLPNRDEWRDVWSEPVGPPIARPFEFVRDRQSSRELPRRGDRIRLRSSGVITLLNYGSVGEAERNRVPTPWNSDSSLANVTGTRVDAGGVYDVGDVFLESLNGVRLVWVRLIAIR